MDVLGLAVVVLEDIAEAAVQHAGPALGQARGVFAGLEPSAAGLGADQLDLGVVDERGEHPRGVRAAAHAGDDRVGQAPDLLQALRPRLAADHRLEVADDHRERMRADHAADRVVRLADEPIQSRIASFVASRRVREPVVTGTTVAPASSY